MKANNKTVLSLERVTELNRYTIKAYLKLWISLFNFFFNISWSDRASRAFGYRATDRRFDIVNCQHVIQEIEFVSIDTHVSARGRIYLLQSQQRAAHDTSPSVHECTHIRTRVRTQKDRSCVWTAASHGTRSIIWSRKSLSQKIIEEGIGEWRGKQSWKIITTDWLLRRNVRWWIRYLR